MTHGHTPQQPKQPSWQSRYSEAMSDNGYELMGAYIAGIMDATSSVSVVVSSQPNARLGYRIVPRIQLQRHQSHLIGVVDNWALEHGIRGTIQQRESASGTKHIYTIENRDEIEQFLKEIEPYLVVKHNAIQILLNEVLPRLRDGVHMTKPGFVETMAYVDMVRDKTASSDMKYSKEYFEEEWAGEI